MTNTLISLSSASRRKPVLVKQPSLARLPGLDESNVYDNGGGDNAPLPANGRVFEDDAVDDGDVDYRESDEEADDDGPEEKGVAQDGADDGERARELLRVHGEEGAGEMLDLPGRDQQQEAKRGKGGRARAVHGLTHVREPLVALRRAAQGHGRLPGPVGHEGKGEDAKGAHEEAVHELVDDDLLCEDAYAEVVGRP